MHPFSSNEKEHNILDQPPKIVGVASDQLCQLIAIGYSY